MKKSRIKIAVAQFAMAESVEENYRNSIRFIERAAAAGADLVTFPEGHLSRYAPQYPGLDPMSFAMSLDHPYVQGFLEACKANHIMACIGLCLLEGETIYATAVLISAEGEILGIGKKNHIVCTDHFYERDYFTPGNEGFVVADTELGRIGLIVCFDRHYPESFRTCVRKGADLILVSAANEKAEPTEMFEWEIRVPAYQNSVNVVMSNRVGTEGAMEFCGLSVIVGPEGEVLARANDRETLLLAEADMASPVQIRAKRQYEALFRPEVFRVDAEGSRR